MKRTISILSVFAFVLAFSSATIAQSGDNTVDASANVLAEITIDDNQAVNFGDISPNFSTTPNLDPTDGSQEGVDGTAVQFGYLLFSAEDGKTIQVEWGDGSANYTETLSGDEEQTETIDYEVAVAEADADATGGSASGTTLSNGDTITINDGSNAQHTLWIGGNLSTTDTTPIAAGAYSGTVTFTLNYDL